MKALLKQLDPMRVAVLLLFGAPLAALVVFGLWWLWQSGYFFYWLITLTVFATLGYGLQYWLMRRQRRLLDDIITEPDPNWPPSADKVWKQVDALAEKIEPDEWPLDDSEKFIELGRLTLETVARAYHPAAERPLLELTVPHTLLIIERASRDLRKDIITHVPFSHRLTIGDMRRMHSWKHSAQKAFTVYRAGRMVVNPIDALVSEAWRYVRDRGLGSAGGEIHRWLLHAYVRKIGYYAIDLYSGRLPLDDRVPETARTPVSDRDTEQGDALEKDRDEEPLRILVAGRANAGKSSLINAMFGELKAAPDVLSDTTQQITPYRLEREGLTRALIFDSPGCDTERFPVDALVDTAMQADMILWVSPVHRPDRQLERTCLERLRGVHADSAEHRPPPVLVAATHIDQLRPLREWQPPYDLASANSSKARNIREAVAVLAGDLGVDLQRVVPVCLAPGRQYNVDDSLWAALLAMQSAALQSRLLRCLEARKRREDWGLLRRQMLGAGRLLRDLPARWWKA